MRIESCSITIVLFLGEGIPIVLLSSRGARSVEKNKNRSREWSSLGVAQLLFSPMTRRGVNNDVCLFACIRICRTVTLRPVACHSGAWNDRERVRERFTCSGARGETEESKIERRRDRTESRVASPHRVGPFNYDSHGVAVRSTNKFRDGHADHAERRESENESGGAEAGSRGKVEPTQGFVW